MPADRAITATRPSVTTLNSTDASRAANSELPASLRHAATVQKYSGGCTSVARRSRAMAAKPAWAACNARISPAVIAPAGQTGRATLSGQEQRVLLVVFRAAQPGDGGEQQPRGQQRGQDRSAAHALHSPKISGPAVYRSSMPRIGYRLLAASLALMLLGAADRAAGRAPPWHQHHSLVPLPAEPRSCGVARLSRRSPRWRS